MNVSKRIILIFLTILGLLSGGVVSMSLVANSRQQTAAAELQRFQSHKLADQLRQSSGDLTRMARTYVVTGDAIYEQYFYEILAIRDGTSPRPKNYGGIYWDYVTATKETPTIPGAPVALIELIKQVGITSQEMAKLEEAKNNSDQLTDLEIMAFGAMKGLFADDTGKLTIRREPDRAFARKILHGDQYHKAKAKIMRPIGEFLDLLDQRTRLEVTVNRGDVDRYQIITITLVATTILFSIFAFFHIKRRIVSPILSLSAIAARIQSGETDERAVVDSDDEIGILNESFNMMSDKNQEMIEGLKREISERKLAEEELEGNQDAFRDFTESSSDWYWEMDEDLRFAHISKGYRSYAGVDPSFYIGKTRQEATAENANDEKWLQHIDDLEHHRPFRDFTFELKTSDGTPSAARISGKPLFNHDGVFRGYRGTGSDITEQWQAEEALRNINEQLEQRVKERTKALSEEIKERKQKEDELETFNQAMVDRELRMIELKEEVNGLASELNREQPYPSVWKRNA